MEDPHEPRAGQRRDSRGAGDVEDDKGIRIEDLPERWVAVVAHEGGVETIDETRRPLYRHLIMHELVGGPSIIRFLDGEVGRQPDRTGNGRKGDGRQDGGRQVDALVVTHAGFDGDEVVTVERLEGGRYAILDYEGPPEGLEEARHRIRAWAAQHSQRPGPVLQVHLMDPVEGIIEEQLQVFLPG